MSNSKLTREQLIAKIELLEAQVIDLKKNSVSFSDEAATVSVPSQFEPIFDQAQATVKEYFKNLKLQPSKGTIEINDERYVLVRASALSYEFITNVTKMYADKSKDEAFAIGKNFLFDVGHVLGMEDAKRFHEKMKLNNPIEKLSAGPVHFAYAGWAFVKILPESNPTPDENFFIKYEHPYSFEADSWLKNGKKSKHTVCIMNSAYSSGWCEQSFGIALTAVEITCKAKGDACCSFIMAPPDKIQHYLDNEIVLNKNKKGVSVPFFFERKKIEERLEANLKEKEVLLKEIHHRVKNNLQIISGLLNLQSSYSNDKRTIDLFNESQNRIKSMATIHEMLYHSSNISKINYAGYLDKLLQDLIRSIKGADNNIRLSIEAKEITLNIDTAIPLGLLINEIITNSLKNGIVDSAKGNLYIQITKKENNSFTLLIGDDGVGYPADLNYTNSKTLGLMLIHNLVLQLDGSIDRDIKKKGTHYTITFNEIS